MAGILNRVLDFVGWEVEGEEAEMTENRDDIREDVHQPHFVQPGIKKQQGKVVSMQNLPGQTKVIIMQPETFDEAQNICDHIVNKQPVVINLEEVEKECAQRIIDFLSGAVYSLEGSIQKVSNGIFVIAPNNVDILGDFKDELKNKSAFSWMR